MKQFTILFLVIIGMVGIVSVGGIVKNKIDQQSQQKQDKIDPVPPPLPVNPTPIPTPPAPPAPVPPDVLTPYLNQAQAANKNIVFFLTSDNCIWCNRMKRVVIPTAKDDLAKFVYVETKDPSIIARFKPTAFPTFVIVDKNGVEVRRETGYMTPGEFHRFLTK